MNYLKELKILYIEDEEIIRDNAVKYLNFYSNHVYSALDGIDGYKKYLDIKPDIIICDIIMPNLNGLELIEKIRRTDLDTQIIILTARINTEYLMKAVELGLIKYLTKPFDENKLLKALNTAAKFIKKKKSNIIKFDKNIVYDIYNKKAI